MYNIMYNSIHVKVCHGRLLQDQTVVTTLPSDSVTSQYHNLYQSGVKIWFNLDKSDKIEKFSAFLSNSQE